MTTVLLSEVRKITTTRIWIVLLAATAAAGVAGAGIYAAIGWFTTGAARANLFDQPDFVATLYTGGNSMARILAIIAGAMSMGIEYRHKTLATSYLAVPGRLSVVTGKAITTFGYGLAFGLVATVLGLLVAIPFVMIKDGSLFLSQGPTWQALLLNVVSLALWAMIGFGFGILIKNMIASVLIAVGFAYIIEPLLNLVFTLKHWTVLANLMPSSATSALIGVDANGVMQTGVTTEAWPAVAAFFVLLGWGLIPAIVGVLTTVRQDVA
jgi:ABC-2 type transport system permease protein